LTVYRQTVDGPEVGHGLEASMDWIELDQMAVISHFKNFYQQQVAKR